MIVNYGYEDASGLWIITVVTEKCDGCGECVEACPYGILEIGPNEYDPLDERPIPRVKDEYRKKIRYSCSPCKPAGRRAEDNPEPCIRACPQGAIRHSW